VLFLALTASAQPEIVVDYRLSLLPSGLPYPGGVDAGFALVVQANFWTDREEPFVVKMNVPPGLEATNAQQCEGTVTFDRATRVLTWSARMDNPVAAINSCPLRFRVDPSLPVGTTLSLNATLTMAKPDPNPSNDTASVTSVVHAAADLEVKSSASPRRLKPGGTIVYTLHVQNRGPQTAQDVVLTDHLSGMVSFVSFEQTSGLPASLDAAPNTRDPECFVDGCSGAIRARLTLPPGSNATFRLTVVVNTSFESGIIRNRVLVAAPGTVELSERDNEFDEFVFAGPDADLAVTSHWSGSTILLRIRNHGPTVVNAVTLDGIIDTAVFNYAFASLAKFAKITPSQGTCTTSLRRGLGGHPPPPDAWEMDCQLGVLAVGAEATIAVTIETQPGAGPFRFTALARPDHNDPRPANNLVQLFSNVRRRSVRK
jgi:uncharacterized repeat protein (TIGR01451 family)